MEKNSKVYVCGHRGMVGSAIVRKLKENGYTNIIVRTSDELDLTKQEVVCYFFKHEMPEYVFLAAAVVGGIQRNIENPVEMLRKNLEIQNNVISNAYIYGVKKLMFFGSSCIYPRHCPQPMKEDYLLTGPFEPSNEGYAIAKIAGLKLCEYYNRQYGTNYISVMPCNLYGVNDHYDNNAHVMSSLIKRFYEAKKNNLEKVTVWGTGSARREFLYVDDMAEAALLLMKNYDKNEFINLGYGTDISIKELASQIAYVVGFEGGIEFDSTKPDGMPQKLLDISQMSTLNWKPEVTLNKGIKLTLLDYVSRFETTSLEITMKDLTNPTFDHYSQ